MTTDLSPADAGMQDVLVTDLKDIVAETDQLLNEVACATVEDFAAARAQIAEKLDDAKGRLDTARAMVAGRARCAAGATHEYVAGHPWQAMAVAAATGLVVGLLANRR